jgi:D-inositol-3-phosphate glycosyltransferase
MNILIVSSYFPPHAGGVEVVAQQQARSLAEAGHSVVVATSRTEPVPADRDDGEGYDVVRLPVSNLLERRTGVPYPIIGPAFCRALAALIRWCDVVHVHDVLYLPPQAAALFARYAGKPMYVTQHVGRLYHSNRAVLAMARLMAALAGRYLWCRARRVIAHNPLVADYLRAHGVPATQVFRAPNGIDTTTFAPGPVGDEHAVRERLGLPGGRPLVLFVGRLVPRKGYQLLVAAADAGYHVVLAGTGRPVCSLPAGVSWIGPVPRADLVTLYRLADVFVLPSDAEVFPLAVQEAMACGLPIVTTEDPGYDACGIDRNLFFLVEPRPAVLRRAIRTILADPSLSRRMSEHSRRFAVEHFDWRVNHQALGALYDQDAGTCDDPHREEPTWTSASLS